MNLSYLEADQITPCQAYTALFRIRERDAKWWALSALGVGIAAALALVASIILFVVGQNGAGIASGVGTVVTGGATGWLWSRRTEVQKEANEFLSKVGEYCPAGQPIA